MDLSLFFVILAAGNDIVYTPTPILANQLNHWWPTIGGIFVALITGIIGYINNKPKNESEKFKAFMEESSDFRDEMRKDKQYLKEEVKELQNKINSLEFELKGCQSRLATCQKDLEECINSLM